MTGGRAMPLIAGGSSVPEPMVSFGHVRDGRPRPPVSLKVQVLTVLVPHGNLKWGLNSRTGRIVLGRVPY